MSMELVTEESEIDGLKFVCTQFSPWDAYPLGIRVVNLLLPALSTMGGVSAENVKSLMKLDLGQLSPPLSAIFEHLALPQNKNLPLDLLRGTTVDLPDDQGEPTRKPLSSIADINYAFAGRMPAMLKAMLFSIKVNFRDFISGALVASLTKAPTKVSPSA